MLFDPAGRVLDLSIASLHPTSTRKSQCAGNPMTEERKYAILFAATLLCARKLMDMDSDRASPAKFAVVENAIRQAAFILERIDRKWPEQ